MTSTSMRWVAAFCAALATAGCGAKSKDGDAATDGRDSGGDSANGATEFEVKAVGQFDEPWAMTFLPDGRLLVTEKRGALKLRGADGALSEISGVPAVDYGGQGGLGDVVLHPDYATNRTIYLSWAEAGSGDTRGAAVGRATLVLDEGGGGRLDGLEVIWRQQPKVTGRGHYGHRLAFSPDGQHLFITSGERQKFDPAQDMATNLGKVIRLAPDGATPSDNPFIEQGDVAAQVWTLGHRNPLGIAFDGNGRLWLHEMGPRGGDEINLVDRGDNYGWPVVSNGMHYDGRPIPDHSERPEFTEPAVWWDPSISPSGFIIYSGDVYPAWRGHGFIGGLSSQSLVRIEFDGDTAREAQRWNMGQRIREVEQSPDGRIFVLEDRREPAGRLLELVPAQ